MKDDIIVGLDIGSHSIRIVAGHTVLGREQGETLQIIGAVDSPSAGISRGVVNSIEDTTSAISACLEKAERLIGVPINKVWVSINGPHIRCEKSRGVVAVGKSDGEITKDDVERAIEAARAISQPPNYETLHVIPVKFSVDSQSDVKDPIGMSGIRLEVETMIIQGLSTQINNLTKAIYRTGLDIEDLVLSPLVAAEAVIGLKQKDLGAALVNIGASTTSLAVFEEGELLHAAVIPIGSEHITADVAIGLRCPINLAERIKLEYGDAVSAHYTKKDVVDVKELADEEEIKEDMGEISLKYVADIIQARTEEIFEKVDDELKKINRSGMLPGGVFLVGGGAKLRNITETGKEKLRLPVAVGNNKIFSSVIDKVNDPNFLTALGLVAWGNNAGGGDATKWPGGATVNKTVKKIQDWMKSLMP